MRIVLIVLDSLGVGQAPDADKFGDVGADTLEHILDKMPNLQIPNLKKLGFLNIDGLEKYGPLQRDELIGSFGKMHEISAGKDTTTGHWEIAGIKTTIPFKTYPEGFPKEFIAKFEEAIGRKTIGNISISGTEIIEKLGPTHEKTGDIIVYTSEDSVFQIAANTAVVPLDELYKICEIARNMLVGKWACGRVIARPYEMVDGKRVRTSDRKDYSVSPPKDTMLDFIKNNGLITYGVGKISDIFNGQGISKSVHTVSNDDGVDKTIEAIKEDFEGIIFTNLVDFDSKYGHRRNPEGYGSAISDFDKRLPEILNVLKKDDILILTADHGNDPTFAGFNHTREYVPLLVCGLKVERGYNLGIRKTFADIAATTLDYLKIDNDLIGTSFLKDIIQ